MTDAMLAFPGILSASSTSCHPVGPLHNARCQLHLIMHADGGATLKDLESFM